MLLAHDDFAPRESPDRQNGLSLHVLVFLVTPSTPASALHQPLSVPARAGEPFSRPQRPFALPRVIPHCWYSSHLVRGIADLLLR